MAIDDTHTEGMDPKPMSGITRTLIDSVPVSNHTES